MKRMSEVFELPLESMQDADDQLKDANGDWALVVRLPWRADYAAHAINHADALADALESALCTIKNLHYKKWLDDDDDESTTFEDSASYSKMKRYFAEEILALAAYRGAK